MGLSRQKARYARALAQAGIDFGGAARRCPTMQVDRHAGGGAGDRVWTAEIYAMFALGRADVFAPGDLALQEAARVLFDLRGAPR